MSQYATSTSPRTRRIAIGVAVLFVLGVLLLSFGPSPSESITKLGGIPSSFQDPHPDPKPAIHPSAPEPAPAHVSTQNTIPDADRRWLIATPMAAKSVTRRMIIRNTWQRLYRANTPFVSKFVFGKVPDEWREYIRAENETYGDLIELVHLEENAHVANTIKSMEFFWWLSQTAPDSYDFISKCDDDSFIDARMFWTKFLEPVRAAGKAHNTTWGRTLHRPDFQYAGGQFYTLTNDLMRSVSRIYHENPGEPTDEDLYVSKLMFEGGLKWDQVDLPSTIAFDYEATDLLDPDMAWANEGADLTVWSHAVGPESINPHKMKTDDDYLKVAACWGEDGHIKQRPKELP